MNNILNKKIVIYAHSIFNLSDGGITVQYYLALVLKSLGIDIKICNIYDNNKPNELFNDFITVNEFKKNYDNDNTIVIYCEGIIGNPLNAKYVVRWILSKLGQNVPLNYYLTWNENDLIYFFNTENELIDKHIDYKQLSLFYINPLFKNLNTKRSDICYTKRKKIIPNILDIHTSNSFEITRNHTQTDYIEIFNRYKQFISYDPLSFLSIIAALCGCISIIYPIPNLSKKEYFKMTAVYDYLISNNLDSLYGIAYGNSTKEIEYSENTLHLLKDQINDIQNWFINSYITNFVNDLHNWDNNKNTLLNYIKSINISTSFIGHFDPIYYVKMYPVLFGKTNYELIQHYINIGKDKKMIPYEQHISFNNYNVEQKNTLINKYRKEIDLRFYRNFYKDLHNKTDIELIEHYITIGKNENRVISRKHFELIKNK